MSNPQFRRDNRNKRRQNTGRYNGSPRQNTDQHGGLDDDINRRERSNIRNDTERGRNYHKMQTEGRARRQYQMGFKFVESLTENEDLENVLFTLNNDRKGFKELLGGSAMSNDMIVLLVKLLSKICSSNFDESKIRILQMVVDSDFTDSITKFICEVPLQGAKEKDRSKHFWNDSDAFWNNVMNICQNLRDLIPMTSCEKIQKILKAMNMYIPMIETTHSLHISDEIKERINHLLNVVQKLFEDLEKKRAQKEIITEIIELDPPDDFREIDVYPTTLEITTDESPFLRRNIIKGPYQNVNHYLDIQFRLLREDFVAPLRKGICHYLNNKKGKIDDIKIYKVVRFLNTETVNEQNCYRVQFDFSGKKRTFQYENSRRFIFGSLMCFTRDNFKSIMFGKVAQRDIKDLEQGHLIIGFNEDVTVPKDIFDYEYLMVESKVFFEPYYQVLNVLKKIRAEDFPMEKYIIHVDTETRPPEYLLNINPVFYTIENYTFWPLNWNSRVFYGLNHAQHDAFKAALTNELSIIQGPPGTGKTFLGLKIAHTLINNKHCWHKKTPMLVICFTNHALDQFLEGLLEVTDEIIRVGSQSKNQKLNEYNIRNTRHTRNETVVQMRRRVRNGLQEIKTINKTIQQIDSYDSIIDFSAFSDVIPQYKYSWFSRVKKDEILKWLFGSQRPSEIAPVNYNFTQEEDPDDNDVAEDYVEENLDMDREDIVDDILDDITCVSFKSLISLSSLSENLNVLTKALNYLQTDETIGPVEKMLKEENIMYELDKLQRDFTYLQRKLSDAAQGLYRGQPEYYDMRKPNLMPPNSRWHLYFYWLRLYRKRLLEKREACSRTFRKDFRFYNEVRDIEDTQVMKNSLVIGMTTSAAARLKSSLQALKSPIVIVEEAAEVLEAHITCSLTSSCKHLILIGDHQQLKPTTANYVVEKKYQLGISLFERMINNNIQCHKLTVQHRMRPEISALIRPAIYPVLEDHESVLNRLPIQGIENCIFFIDHEQPEELCSDNSKKNRHEASFLIKLAKHLVLNGYKQEDITILAAYLGQMFEMTRLRKQEPLLKDIKITVLDNFQGEENDIILLSLVRSNDEGNVGFLSIENRICVALSRAKHGFYIMGNMTQLCKKSDIWVQVKQSLETQNAIGPNLTLRCQIHKHKLTAVKCADDFMKVPEGGCDLLCGAVIGCGHSCKSLCHIEDREHASYRCLEKCNRVLCNNEEHVCQKLCYEVCGPCCYPVEQNLDCGHKVVIECHIDPLVYDCIVKVKAVLPCGHEVEKPCFRKPDTFRCPELCAIRVEPCGHACTRSCHINSDPDHLEYKCRKPCVKAKIGCTLPDDMKHICSKFCHEECEPCDEGIKKQRTICPHVYIVPCRVNVDEIECKKPCVKTLPCGHKCKNICEAPCGNCNVKVKKTVPVCNHEVNIECSEEPDRKFCGGKCPRLLPCGHQCDKKCMEPCTTFCKVNVSCSIPSPCGHVIKNISCYLKSTGDPKVLLKHCDSKCNMKLKCGHLCGGSCGECLEGRIHQRCKQKCGNTLICNHECPIPCSEACKPCEKKCNYKCRHNTCNRKCGEPCNKCKEKCTRKCQHQTCKKLCGEVCNIPPCYEPCKKSLKCGHPCVGFCRDPCPLLCRICNREELTEIFLGNEDEDDAIYVMLEDCKHIFESGDIEKWLQSDGEIMTKFCPRCKTPITSTERFKEYTIKSMADIINIKNKSFGIAKDNDLRRIEYLHEIDEIQEKSGKLYENTYLRFAIHKLKNRLQISRKDKKGQNRRQTLNMIDLDVIKSKLQLIDFIISVFSEQNNDILPTDKSAIHISFIVRALMRDEYHITQQEIEDIQLEIERLQRIVQYEKIEKSVNFSYAKTKNDVKNKISYIDRIIDSPQRYNKEIDNILQKEISELNQLVGASLHITEVERREIVGALGLQKGHWFKCPNGHYYVITECGGAMQISKCNECGAAIGGQSHALLPGQRHAPEMDDSRYPAWSEAANLANYRLI